MNILRLNKVRKISSTDSVRYFIELITASLYSLTPFAAVIFAQAKTDDLKLRSVVKPKYRSHQMCQWMITKIVTHVAHP